MEKKEILVDPEKLEWEKIALPGIRVKYLNKNEQTGASMALCRFEKGAGIPEPHLHASNQLQRPSAKPLRHGRREAHIHCW